MNMVIIPEDDFIAIDGVGYRVVDDQAKADRQADHQHRRCR